MRNLRKNHSIGEFVVAKHVKIIKQKGCYWNTIGFHEEGNLLLYPEEALYLINEGNLLLQWENDSFDQEDNYKRLKKMVPKNDLNVYFNLKQAGYIVRRHKFENQIVQYNKNSKQLLGEEKFKKHDGLYNIDSILYKLWKYTKHSSDKNISNHPDTYSNIMEKLPNLQNNNFVDFYKFEQDDIQYIPKNIFNICLINDKKSTTCMQLLNPYLPHKYYEDDYQDAVLSFNKYKFMNCNIPSITKNINDWYSYKKEYFKLYEEFNINQQNELKNLYYKDDINCRTKGLNANIETLKIQYDVYKPNKSFSKSKAGPPDYYVHIVQDDPYNCISDHLWLQISSFLKTHACLQSKLLIAYCDENEPQFIQIEDIP